MQIPTIHTFIRSIISHPSRSGVKLDERTASLIQMKCLPLVPLIQAIYPDLYRVDNLELAKTMVCTLERPLSVPPGPGF